MTKLTIFSRVGNASTEFETEAATFGEIINEFWQTVNVPNRSNLKVIDSETRLQVTEDFRFKQSHKFFVMQDQTKNNFTKTLEELQELLKKAQKQKKATKEIRAQIAALTEQITDEDEDEDDNVTNHNPACDSQIKEKSVSKISNIRINEECISPEDVQFLNNF